jgi:GH25 family lysozyme M1 (1,4-beta-N-acetylmuramidase)
MTAVKITQRLLLVAALGAAFLGTTAAPAPAATKPLGVDVSRFNGVIDWPTVSAAGIGFAFVQASRGSGLDCTVKPTSCGADPYWLSNYANAKAAGVRVGAYHRGFATGSTAVAARADALAEANVFISQVGQIQGGDLLPVLDVEAPFTGMNAVSLRAWIRTWLVRVKKRLGAQAMIYTNNSSWGATGNTTIFARKHPLWVAAWNVARPIVPAANWGGRGWSVWQHTSSGSVPGISGRVDQNRLAFGLGKITVR